MSIITDFLKLFKYDPETDGASTFNIKQCLNDNWDKIDAWASGIKTTIAGLVPGTRKINNKALSADVTLTGDDIKTSASDNTPIGDVVSVLGGATTPQGALANLGAGVRPNLLINPFFEVNQRGQTSYSGGASYFIDLWKLSDSAMSVQISDDHISITSASTYQSFEQRIENYKELFGKTLTLSALVKGVSGNTVGIAIGNTNTSSGVYFRERFTCTGNWQLITMTFTLSEISSGDTYLAVMCYPEFTNGGTGGTSDWMAAKLEEGSTQTLAYQDDTGAWQLLPQPESDYATQLAKCQRYYQIYSTADARPSKAVDCRPVMRTDPAQGTIVVGDTTYYYNTAEL